MKKFYDVFVQCSVCGAEIHRSVSDVEPKVGDRESVCSVCAEKYEELTGIHYDEFVAVEVAEDMTLDTPEELAEWFEESRGELIDTIGLVKQWDENEERHIPEDGIQIVSVTVMAAPPWRLPEREWVTLSEIPSFVRKSEGAVRQDFKRGKFSRYMVEGLVQNSGGVHLIHLDAVREVYRDEWVGDGATETERKYTVAIDLNGVLDQYSGWKGEGHEELPKEGVREFLENLSQKYRVVIHTTQPVPKVWKWLDRHNLSDYVARVTNRKVPAVVYLDDRAIRFDGDFEEVLEEIKHFRPHWKR